MLDIWHEDAHARARAGIEGDPAVEGDGRAQRELRDDVVCLVNANVCVVRRRTRTGRGAGVRIGGRVAQTVRDRHEEVEVGPREDERCGGLGRTHAGERVAEGGAVVAIATPRIEKWTGPTAHHGTQGRQSPGRGHEGIRRRRDARARFEELSRVF